MSGTGKTDLVSVVLPTYNRARLLPATLESVLKQTHRPIEIIVIDDGSTDETEKIIGRFKKKCDEAKGVSLRAFHQTNRGSPAARNLGLIHSRGNYIQHLDSDDLLAPEKIERQMGALKSSEPCDFVWSETASFRDSLKNRKPLCGGNTEEPLTDFVRFDSWPWHVWGGLFRRDAVRRLGPWNERLLCWGDWEYMVRFLCQRPDVHYLPGTFSFYRLHNEGRLTDFQTTSRGIKVRLAAIETVEQDLIGSGNMKSAFRKELTRYYYWVGRLAMRKELDDVARRSLGKALRAPLGPAWLLRSVFMLLLLNISGAHRACKLLSPFSRMESTSGA